MSATYEKGHEAFYAGRRSRARVDCRRMRGALRRLARAGCSRLTDPSTCRKPNGYPNEEWCEGCIAADALGMSVEWFVMKP